MTIKEVGQWREAKESIGWSIGSSLTGGSLGSCFYTRRIVLRMLGAINNSSRLAH